MTTKIINRGRGPEIDGTRITVFDILDYRKHGWHGDRIAALFRLSSDDVQAAFDYIDTNSQVVMEGYEQILQRHRSHEYSADVKVKLDQCRGIATARLAELRRSRLNEEQHAGNHGRS